MKTKNKHVDVLFRNFLGDSVYCITTNSLYHFKQSKLLPMIEDIQKYDAIHFILGHESICDLDEMNS